MAVTGNLWAGMLLNFDAGEVGASAADLTAGGRGLLRRGRKAAACAEQRFSALNAVVWALFQGSCFAVLEERNVAVFLRKPACLLVIFRKGLCTFS